MEIVIRPKNKWWKLDIHELWNFRDLFYFLTWRDVKVKYKQTTIGVLWAVFQPVVSMIVFSIFFGKFIGIPSEGIPYPVFVFTGLIFWTFFSAGLLHASNSFVENERIITKVYFPRVIVPISSIITNLIDFLIATIILLLIMFYYGFTPSLTAVLIFPLLVIMTILSTLGIGLLFASLNVKYRDVRFILPFFFQTLIFITPVIYPVSVVSEKYRWILGLNPMSGVIDAARSFILQTKPLDMSLFIVSIISMTVYCIFGYLYFKKVEKYFADII